MISISLKSYYTLVSSNFMFQNTILGPVSARVSLIVFLLF